MKDKGGRPPGRKNNKTLLKELAIGQAIDVFGNELAPRLPAIVAKLADMAEEGDTAAIKIILDRLVPVRRATDEKEDTRQPIIVNVGVTYGKGHEKGEQAARTIEGTAHGKNGASLQASTWRDV